MSVSYIGTICRTEDFLHQLLKKYETDLKTMPELIDVEIEKVSLKKKKDIELFITSHERILHHFNSNLEILQKTIEHYHGVYQSASDEIKEELNSKLNPMEKEEDQKNLIMDVNTLVCLIEEYLEKAQKLLNHITDQEEEKEKSNKNKPLPKIEYQVNKEYNEKLISELKSKLDETHNDYKDELANITKTLTDQYSKLSDNSSDNEKQTTQDILKKLTTIVENQSRSSLENTHFTLPTFEGKKELFSMYWGRFKRLIDTNPTYSTLDKLNMLCESLKGEASLLIQGIEPSIVNYDVIKKALFEEYGDYLADTAKLISTLQDMPPAGHNPESCKATLMMVRTVIRQLESANSPISVEHCFGVVPEKFPYRVSKKILQTQPRDWTVNTLLQELSDHIKEFEIEEKSKQRYFNKRPEATISTIKQRGLGHKVQTHTHMAHCIFCGLNNHKFFQCKREDTPQKRRTAIKGKHICWICFNDDHISRDCSKGKCKQCEGDHNSLLCLKTESVDKSKNPHMGKRMNNEEKQNHTNVHTLETEPKREEKGVDKLKPGYIMEDLPIPKEATVLPAVNHHMEDIRNIDNCQVNLRTAKAFIFNHTTNNYEPINILVDEGSMRSFIKEDLARKLQLPVTSSKNRTFYGMGGMSETYLTKEVKAIITSKKGKIVVTKFLTKPKITQPLRSPILSERDIEFIQKNNICLANSLIRGETFEPDLLLGMDRYKLFVNINGEVEFPSSLRGKESVFGLLIHGEAKIPEIIPEPITLFTAIETEAREMNIQDIIKNLFEIDGLGINTEQSAGDSTDDYFEKYSPLMKLKNNRILAPLPLKPTIVDLKSNKAGAFYRFKNLWEKLQYNPTRKEHYVKIIKTYIQQGIIEVVNEEHDFSNTNIKFYLPHHGVWKESKTKPLRIVFDASAKERNSPSLNDVIHTGASYINKIHDILIKCRLSPIIITADIEAAFLQIELLEEHKDLCRFFFVKDPAVNFRKGNLETYRFCRLPFGITASPSVLNMALTWFLGNQNIPLAKEILSNLYVDNIVLSAESTEEAQEKIKEVQEIFRRVHMRVREFLTNDEQAFKNIVEDLRFPNKEAKILGIPYNSITDTFIMKINIPIIEEITTRGLLRQLHSVHDPIGVFAPVLLPLKLILREAFNMKLGWDKSLPDEMANRWQGIIDNIQGMKAVLPRHIVNNGEISAWIFADASVKASAVVAYLMSAANMSTIINGKVRIASRKDITIPKRELLAIRIAMRLAINIQSIISNLTSIHIISDSTIALQWVLSNKELPTFIRIQTKSIQKMITQVQEKTPITFHHINSEKNIADIGSRGASPEELYQSEWLKGPTWLKEKEKFLVNMGTWIRKKSNSNERLDLICFIQEKEDNEIMFRKESYTDSVRHFVWVGKQARKWLMGKSGTRRTNSWLWQLGTLFTCTTRDFITAENQIIRMAQADYNEITLPNIYINHHLFKDEKAILRIRSRLEHASIPYETKNPIFLLKTSPLTRQLINHIHITSGHQGVKHVFVLLRQRFYISSVLPVIKRELKQCTRCRRYQGLPFGAPDMPALPRDRVTLIKPFTYTGCDLMGPIRLRSGKKAYVCLFTCLTIRAIHIEIVSSQSTGAFLNAFSRFISRRGTPAYMRSDCGGNFVLASKTIELLDKTKEFSLTNPDISHYFTEHKLIWLFNTPLSPWKGGVWERLIGSIKLCLKKSIGIKPLSLDELHTAVVKIEAILNTRPIAYPLSENLNTLPIRPIDFLGGNIAYSLPDNNLRDRTYTEELDIPTLANVERAMETLELITDMASTFWKRFQEEYLILLRNLYKFKRKQGAHKTRGPIIGEVVIIHSNNIPRGAWKLGIITELLTSEDGFIRSAKLKTFTENELIRPITQLYPLEIQFDISETPRQGTPVNDNQQEITLQKEIEQTQQTEQNKTTESPVDIDENEEQDDQSNIEQINEESGTFVQDSSNELNIDDDSDHSEDDPTFVVRGEGETSSENENIEEDETTVKEFSTLNEDSKKEPRNSNTQNEAGKISGEATENVPDTNAEKEHQDQPIINIGKPINWKPFYKTTDPELLPLLRTQDTVTIPQPPDLRYTYTPETRPRKAMSAKTISALTKALGMICLISLIEKVDTSHECQDAEIFSRHLLGNPHCSPESSLWSVFFIITIVGMLVACFWRLLHRQYQYSTWSQHFNNCWKNITKTPNETHPTAPDIEMAEQKQDNPLCSSTNVIASNNFKMSVVRYPKISIIHKASQLSLPTILIICFLGQFQFANSCTDSHILQSVNIICPEAAKCFQQFNTEIMFTPGNNQACIQMRYGDHFIGYIKIRRLFSEHRCKRNIMYYTKVTNPLITTTLRCRHMGECDGLCETMKSSSKIKDLEPYIGPAQTGCKTLNTMNIFRCFTSLWSNPCLFYKLEHTPINDEIYEVYTCDNWETVNEFEIEIDWFHHKNTYNISLIPYVKRKEQTFNITNISQMKAPPRLYSLIFYSSKNRTFATNADFQVSTQCHSMEQAREDFHNCSTKIHCPCRFNRYEEVACVCPNHNFETEKNSDRLKSYNTKIISENLVVRTNSEETRVIIESSAELNTTIFSNNIHCRPVMKKLSGCYACARGAELEFECLSSERGWIVMECGTEVFMIECSTFNPITRIGIKREKAIINEQCTTRCNNKEVRVKLEGRLIFESDVAPLVEPGSKKKRENGWFPDLEPLLHMSLTHWKLTLLGLILFICCSLLSYIGCTPALFMLMIWLGRGLNYIRSVTTTAGSRLYRLGKDERF